MAAVMMPGTTNDRPQGPLTQTPGIRVPRMLPTDVWEFQMPMMNPRLEGGGGEESRRSKKASTGFLSAAPAKCGKLAATASVPGQGTGRLGPSEGQPGLRPLSSTQASQQSSCCPQGSSPQVFFSLFPGGCNC